MKLCCHVRFFSVREHTPSVDGTVTLSCRPPVDHHVICIFLTAISYGWVTGSGEDDSKRKLYATSDNGRVLGPVCLVVSVVMFVATAVLRTLSANARFRQTRVGFHCPVHGDFFPISPGPDPRKFSCESSRPVTAGRSVRRRVNRRVPRDATGVVSYTSRATNYEKSVRTASRLLQESVRIAWCFQNEKLIYN